MEEKVDNKKIPETVVELQTIFGTDKPVIIHRTVGEEITFVLKPEDLNTPAVLKFKSEDGKQEVTIQAVLKKIV